MNGKGERRKQKEVEQSKIIPELVLHKQIVQLVKLEEVLVDEPTNFVVAKIGK